MEIRVLRYFLMVAREENITKAAELLHITQPTLSRQLMQLEEELETKLFKMSSGTVRKNSRETFRLEAGRQTACRNWQMLWKGSLIHTPWSGTICIRQTQMI